MAFTAPSMIMMVFCSFYSMMGSIFAAKFISQEAMSAINLVSPYTLAVIAISVMFSTGANAIIAKQLGEGNTDKARQNFTVIMLLGITV